MPKTAVPYYVLRRTSTGAAAEPVATGSATVVALKAVTLALGATLTCIALRAHLRTKSPALRGPGVGFSLVTTGFLALTYSLYAGARP